jgi:hypothetical protein
LANKTSGKTEDTIAQHLDQGIPGSLGSGFPGDYRPHCLDVNLNISKVSFNHDRTD